MTEQPPGSRRESRPWREVYSVSRLNETAKDLLEGKLGMLWVEGEISNLARPASGHVYFSLKDRNAQIRCAMFRRRTSGTTHFMARDGMSVMAYGRVSLYTARGDYQLIVEALEDAGEGLLRLRFEELKRRLAEEGLFEPAHKQALPQWPRAVGVVTSTTGAAVRDIITVLGRRCAALPVIVYPTSVQGEGAAAEIARAIETANRRDECDVLIVGRGGGSLEDLWAFNEERVARAIFASRIPIVSAVGHEIDFTIADLVADVRAATPSAAAELVSPDVAAMTGRLIQCERRLIQTVRHSLIVRRHQMKGLERRLVSPRRRLEQLFQRLDELALRLPSVLSTQLNLRRSRLQALSARLQSRSPQRDIAARAAALASLRHRLLISMRQILIERRQALARIDSLLRAVGPQATLDRGYAIVTDRAGQLVKSSAQIKAGDSLTTRLAEGRLESVVTASHPPPTGS